MKLIIFEGIDNQGKTTLIHNISRKFNSSVIRKFGAPSNDLTGEQKRRAQEAYFFQEMRFYQMLKGIEITNKNDNVVMWDRSHLGEQVYATLYRQNDPVGWLYNLEKTFGVGEDLTTYLVLLESDTRFVIQNDDGLSLTMDFTQLVDFWKTTYPLFNHGQFGNANLSDLNQERIDSFFRSTVGSEVERTFAVESSPDGILYKNLKLIYDEMDAIYSTGTFTGDDLFFIAKRLEKAFFEYSYSMSSIPNKVRIRASFGTQFRPAEDITMDVVNFINNGTVPYYPDQINHQQ